MVDVNKNKAFVSHFSFCLFCILSYLTEYVNIVDMGFDVKLNNFLLFYT